MLKDLMYHLGVLAKAVQYKNLTAASSHIGLSQPQLSRIISKIENELKIVLLDRSVRRKSEWTQVAQELSTIFLRNTGRLESEILSTIRGADVSELHIGTLEGLSLMASDYAKKCFDQFNFKKIYLDILNFKDLDSLFLNHTLDLIFTVKRPTREKLSRIREFGFQQMGKVVTDKSTLVISSREISECEKKTTEEFDRFLVSNSLSLRKYWIEKHGGTGALPVNTKTEEGEDQHTIYLIGRESMPMELWLRLSSLPI